jgi:ABC-2 type transport system permease protein
MNGLNIRAALRVARKDLQIFLKERGTLFFLFVIPIVFIVGFGAGTGRGSEPQEKAIPLPVVNLDAGSEASSMLLAALDQSGSIQCEPVDEARAKAQLKKGKIHRLLTIPANYAADLQAGRPVTLRLENHPNASAFMTEAVHRMVASVAADLSLEMQLIASFRQMADMEAAASPEQQAFTAEIIVEQAQSQFARSRTEPLLAVEESWPKHLQEEDEEGTFRSLNVLVPGFAVLFIFLTAQTTARTIYEEKKEGSFRRLLAAPINKTTILAGKMMPNLLTGLAQIVVLFGAGVLVLPALGLGSMSLGNDPLALVLLCLTLLLCSTSLGLLIAAIARTEGQIGGLSSAVLWVLGFAGVLLTRMSLTSPLDTIAKAIPHYWANVAFLDLFVRGQSLVDIMPSLLALLGFGVAFLAVGLWRFKFN